MKDPISHEGYEQRSSYKQWILNYLKEQGVTYTDWKSIQPLYNRYRARCLKLKPTTELSFRNLCTFDSTRKVKYDTKGELKDGAQVGWKKKDKKEATGSRDVICRIRKDYKLNYKAPPKKEDFEVVTDYRLASKDWSYLRDQLSDFEGVKVAIKKVGKQEIAPVVESRYLTTYPWLIRYAFRCLSGVYPIECFPEVLNERREELQELLEKQREAYSANDSETILNDLVKYLGGIKHDR